MKKIKKFKKAIILSLFCVLFSSTAYASDSDEYITITVDAEDDSEKLMYALDSTDEASFSNSNIFRIPAGTSHTIYVRDAAGNITSQSYSPKTVDDISELSNEVTEILELQSEDTQDISIDLEIGNDDDYEYLTDSPAEPGEGTVHDKTKTEGNDDNAKKLFYTVTTAEGNVFYMVIDQNQKEDNVYFLNAVTNSDLEALAVDDNDDGTIEKDTSQNDNLLEALASEQGNTNNESSDIITKSESGSNSRSNSILILALMAIGGGVYYYFKVYKNKKDEAMDMMDAMNMEDFEPEEQEDDEEAEFEFADEEKQAYLDRLINDEEIVGFNEDNNDDLYATSHIEDYEDYQDYKDENELKDNNFYDEELVADFESEYDEELDGEEE